MTQPHSTIDPQTPATSSYSLVAALSSLDVELEAELARFRRSKGPQRIDLGEGVPISFGSDRWEEDDSPLDYGETDPHGDEIAAEFTDFTTLTGKSSFGAAEEGPIIPLEEVEPAPEDYLDSSEQLLKSLENLDHLETATPGDRSPVSEAREREKKPFFLNPLTLGSLISLVLLAALLSRWDGLQQFRDFPQISLGEKTTDTPPAPITANPQSDRPDGLPGNIDLSAEEFVDIDLNNLGSLGNNPTTPPATPDPPPPPSGDPNAYQNQQTVAPVPPVRPQPQVLSNPLLMPTDNGSLASRLLPPSLQPQPATVVAMPIPTPPPPVVNSEAAEAAKALGLNPQLHYVVAIASDGENVNTVLNKINPIFPGALLRQFPEGQAIQLGAVITRQEAQNLAAQWQKNEIKTAIYHYQ